MSADDTGGTRERRRRTWRGFSRRADDKDGKGKPILDALQPVGAWPEEDQAKLLAAMGDIKARRAGIDPASLGQFVKTLTIAAAKQALDEPTKYWEERKEDYLSNAYGWATGFAVGLGLAVLAVVVLLFAFPALELNQNNEKVAIAQFRCCWVIPAYR